MCSGHRGQVFPVVLAGILLAAGALLVMASIGNRFAARTVVVNAADAAAYSGAVWTARHLNFLAYTNRAMIANHIGVGHFIAYLSWLRYIEDGTGKLAIATRAIPFVNAATRAVDRFAEALVDLAEFEAEVFVPATDILNRFYFIAQAETQASLVFNPVNDVMQTTAERFDPALGVNDDGAIASLPASVSAPVRLALGVQRLVIPLFVRPLSVIDRDGELVNVVEATYGSLDVSGLSGNQRALVDQLRGSMSDAWLNDRGWTENAFLIELEKEFDTTHELSNDLSTWSTEDELELRLLPVSPTGSITKVTLASGRASTTEFDDGYRGIFAYYNQTLFEPAEHTLPILALVSMPQSAAAVAGGGPRPRVQRLHQRSRRSTGRVRPTGHRVPRLRRRRGRFRQSLQSVLARASGQQWHMTTGTRSGAERNAGGHARAGAYCAAGALHRAVPGRQTQSRGRKSIRGVGTYRVQRSRVRMGCR